MEPYHSVVVVGAGAAGLFAASVLRSRFPDLVVLEAQDHVGGRIKQVRVDLRRGGAAAVLVCEQIIVNASPQPDWRLRTTRPLSPY